MTPEQVRQARKMFADGESVAAIARVLGVSRPTVYRYLEPAATDPPTVGVQ
jgi:DNA invertase Pin-like site-specific DNA recombinase